MLSLIPRLNELLGTDSEQRLGSKEQRKARQSHFINLACYVMAADIWLSPLGRLDNSPRDNGHFDGRWCNHDESFGELDENLNVVAMGQQTILFS